MRRNFPALFAVLFFCILAASILRNPNEMIAFGKTLLATTFFVSNVYFWKTAHPLGYFDTEVNSKPLLHTWYLSVEEQFYVIFPMLLFLLFCWARTRTRIWLVLLTAISFALNLWATQHKPVLAFYWFMPRAWELSIGALLAVKVVPQLRNRAIREAAGALGLTMIVSSLFLPVSHWGFPAISCWSLASGRGLSSMQGKRASRLKAKSPVAAPAAAGIPPRPRKTPVPYECRVRD